MHTFTRLLTPPAEFSLDVGAKGQHTYTPMTPFVHLCFSNGFSSNYGTVQKQAPVVKPFECVRFPGLGRLLHTITFTATYFFLLSLIYVPHTIDAKMLSSKRKHYSNDVSEVCEVLPLSVYYVVRHGLQNIPFRSNENCRVFARFLRA